MLLNFEIIFFNNKEIFIMKKITKILSAVAFSAAAAFATDDSNIVCSHPDMEATACETTIVNPNLVLDVRNGIFHNDPSQKIDFQGKAINLRLEIPSTSPYFKELQAIAQTGLAAGATIRVMFPNPRKVTSYMMSASGSWYKVVNNGSPVLLTPIDPDLSADPFNQETCITNATAAHDMDNPPFIHCKILNISVAR